MLKRTFTLPLGYAVTFSSDPSQGEAFSAEWSPSVPVIRKVSKRRKFVEAYKAARSEFVQELASVLGANVLVVDADKNLERAEDLEVVRPPSMH